MANGHEIASITPFPLAMIVCDFIYRDPFNGKYTLIGTFSTINGASFPLLHPHLFVYAALTGGRGVLPVRLDVIAPDEEGTVIAAIPGQFDATDDPRAITELGIAIANITFPIPGEYRLSLFVNGEFMVERRLLLMDVASREEGEGYDC